MGILDCEIMRVVGFSHFLDDYEPKLIPINSFEIKYPSLETYLNKFKILLMYSLDNCTLYQICYIIQYSKN